MYLLAPMAISAELKFKSSSMGMIQLFWTIIATAIFLLTGGVAFAGPVDWIQVPSTELGEQWWDRGSLREDRDGLRTVLSRFTPAPTAEGQQASGDLYVMQLDCAQQLYRDKQVNGIPRFRSSWQAAADDGLITSVIEAVCSETLPG